MDEVPLAQRILCDAFSVTRTTNIVQSAKHCKSSAAVQQAVEAVGKGETIRSAALMLKLPNQLFMIMSQERQQLHHVDLHLIYHQQKKRSLQAFLYDALI